jgi:hypothetical protein
MSFIDLTISGHIIMRLWDIKKEINCLDIRTEEEAFASCSKSTPYS